MTQIDWNLFKYLKINKYYNLSEGQGSKEVGPVRVVFGLETPLKIRF